MRPTVVANKPHPRRKRRQSHTSLQSGGTHLGRMISQKEDSSSSSFSLSSSYVSAFLLLHRLHCLDGVAATPCSSVAPAADRLAPCAGSPVQHEFSAQGDLKATLRSFLSLRKIQVQVRY